LTKTINIKGELFDLTRPVVMGILNITPDSFYESSRKTETSTVLKRVEQILTEGASIVDIGAQSTRPKSEFLSAEEEIKRLTPALDAINREFPDTIISVDTFYSDVARYCIE